MSRRTDEARTRALEALSRTDPAGYRRQVVLFGLLGYGYVLLVTAVAVALFAGSVWMVFHAEERGGWIQFALMSGVSLYMVLASLLVPLEPAGGHPLRWDQAPLLFEDVAAMARQLEAPQVRRILLNEEFNASVHSVPRWGFFGPLHHDLVLGLPLMKSLSHGEMRSVIAHELGHLSKQHGHLGAWIVRLQITWTSLQQAVQSSWTGLPFKPFLDWYLPVFERYTRVLSRQQEFEADAVAARMTNSRDAAAALVRIHSTQPLYDGDFWKTLLHQSTDAAQPPRHLFAHFEGWWAGIWGEQRPQRTLAQALRQRGGMMDTHPSLAERLDRLQQQAQLAPRPALHAARHYFGDGLPALEAEAAESWATQVAAVWHGLHEEHHRLFREWSTLDAAHRRGEPLAEHTLWRCAQLTERFHGATAARPLLLEHARRFPDHPEGAFALGRIELEQGNELGVMLLKKVIEKDSAFGTAALDLLIQFHRARGEAAAAEALLEDYDRHAAMDEEARKERLKIGARDTLTEHDLPDEELEPIVRVLAGQPKIDKAWLVRKAVKIHPRRPFYVLAIQPTGEWWKLRDDSDEATLVLAVLAELETRHEIRVIAPQFGGKRGVFKRITFFRQALIYTRNSHHPGKAGTPRATNAAPAGSGRTGRPDAQSR